MRTQRLPVFLALALAAVLGLLVAPDAQASPHCSESDLQGSYAGNFGGTITGVGPVAAQILAIYNGDGTATGVKTTLMSGTGGPTTFTSTVTYTLNADCTGTLTVVRSTGQTTHYVIVVTGKNAEEIHILATDPGSVVTGVSKAVR